MSPPTRPGPAPGAAAALLMMGWLTLVLLLDSDGSRTTQWLLGAATWAVLGVVLLRRPVLVRAQTLVVVVFATAVEYAFSAGLEVYVYRFDNVPAYVPPGHGLVYLSALALGSSSLLRARPTLAAAVVLVPLGTWAAHGLLVAERSDALGAFWFGCLLCFLRWGPSREVYVGAAVVVTWLELAGTHLGTWVWQPQDPVGWLSIGNPPSGAAGGYGWFDLAALLTAPVLLRWWTGTARRVRSVTGRAAAAPVGAASPPAVRDAGVR